jgi:hypothetical protein
MTVIKAAAQRCFFQECRGYACVEGDLIISWHFLKNVQLLAAK